jgi:flagellar motility protein MotE (MotC chaperone)
MSKKKTMSREEAVELYNDLQNSMNAIMQGKAPAKVVKPKSEYFKTAAKSVNKNVSGVVNSLEGEGGVTTSFTGPRSKDRGVIGAITFLLFCGMFKLGVAVIEYTGVMSPTPAEAAMATGISNPTATRQIIATPQNGLSPEDIKILTALDSKRVELEERSKRLDSRENDISKRDKDFVLKLSEIRELTEKLKLERDKGMKKDQGQLDQLANVYGSMAPQEAAKLIEQLDVTIALPLLQRMPEKRMGLILPMMSAEKALIITKLLSGQR